MESLYRLAVLGMVLTSGCSSISIGQSFNTKLAAEIKEGDTKSQVTAALGRPLLRLADAGNEIWVYQQGRINTVGFPLIFVYLGSQTAKTEELRLDFKGENLLKSTFITYLGLPGGSAPVYSGLPLPPEKTKPVAEKP